MAGYHYHVLPPNYIRFARSNNWNMLEQKERVMSCGFTETDACFLRCVANTRRAIRSSHDMKTLFLLTATVRLAIFVNLFHSFINIVSYPSS
mmetsp:Transcript_3319/g.5142  ORF Transcript_3319/g.5142 Transcript_3319/m.5142 type:complete len:92 (-) Transcript_3319:149-424(-)